MESFATPGLWATEDVCIATSFDLFLSLIQIVSIISKFGLVVVSRFGSNPEKFIYESDILHSLKVLLTTM